MYYITTNMLCLSNRSFNNCYQCTIMSLRNLPFLLHGLFILFILIIVMRFILIYLSLGQSFYIHFTHVIVLELIYKCKIDLNNILTLNFVCRTNIILKSVKMLTYNQCWALLVFKIFANTFINICNYHVKTT